MTATFDGPVYAVAAGAGQHQRLRRRRIQDRQRRGSAGHRPGCPSRTACATATFTGAINWGDVRELITSGPWLYAGGAFTRIGGVDRVGAGPAEPATGAGDPAFNAGIAAPNLSRARVEDFAISPDGSRLVAVGAIEQAGGNYRAQLAMLDLTTDPPRLADWFTDAYTRKCRSGFETYLRGVDFAPDGASFAVVTTGRQAGPNRTCDTAARFEVAGTGLHRPTWVNHTGGDSLYAVSFTGSAVYVGGHQRWHNNPYGNESAGRGAVNRKGIAALDPRTGLATPWNPTRRRGVGVQALLSPPRPD